MNWMELLAALINTACVLAAVQALKIYLPILNEKVPYLLPIIAGAAGPLIAFGQNYLSQLIGYPIDLSPMLAVFTGAAAVAVHQVVKQAEKNGT